MTKPLISLSDLLAKAEAAIEYPLAWEDGARRTRIERFNAAASPDVVKALVEIALSGQPPPVDREGMKLWTDWLEELGLKP